MYQASARSERVRWCGESSARSANPLASTDTGLRRAVDVVGGHGEAGIVQWLDQSAVPWPTPRGHRCRPPGAAPAACRRRSATGCRRCAPGPRPSSTDRPRPVGGGREVHLAPGTDHRAGGRVGRRHGAARADVSSWSPWLPACSRSGLGRKCGYWPPARCPRPNRPAGCTSACRSTESEMAKRSSGESGVFGPAGHIELQDGARKVDLTLHARQRGHLIEERWREVARHAPPGRDPTEATGPTARCSDAMCTTIALELGAVPHQCGLAVRVIDSARHRGDLEGSARQVDGRAHRWRRWGSSRPSP